MNFFATLAGFLLDLTLFRNFARSSLERGPLQVGRPADLHVSSSVCESSNMTDSVSVTSIWDVGVEIVGVGLSRACEIVGDSDDIGESLLAIFLAGEGVVSGTK